LRILEKELETLRFQVPPQWGELEVLNPLSLGGFKSPSSRVQYLFFEKRKMTPKIYFVVVVFN